MEMHSPNPPPMVETVLQLLLMMISHASSAGKQRPIAGGRGWPLDWHLDWQTTQTACIGTCVDPDTSCMGAQGSAMQKGVS